MVASKKGPWAKEFEMETVSQSSIQTLTRAAQDNANPASQAEAAGAALKQYVSLITN